jgi:hypothetical protein
MKVVKYNIPYRGLGTEFSQVDQPVEFANNLTNRFINLFGQAEKRQGLKKLGNQISSQPNLNGFHEFVNVVTNASTYFVSGEGKIFRYNSSTSDWDLVLSGKDSSSIMISRQMSNKLIFVNGVDRNFYTDDAGNNFKELQAIINKGTMGAGTSSTELTDAKITNWTNQTYVTINDIVYNSNTGAQAIITSVGSTDLDTSPTGSAATGVGFASDANVTGNLYEIWDAVEANVIKTAIGNDNVALTTTGTNNTTVAVSGVDFSTTEIKTGDYVYNSTRNALTQVRAVSANVVVTTVASQVAGDTVTFHKKAMPIATYAHVHYGRLYLIDARDQTKVRISGPDDPQDFTTETKTLASNTIDYGSRYTKGAALKSLSSFGKYLVAGGNANVFVDDGQTPISDTSGKSTDLRPVGGFSQGCLSKFGLANIGSDMLYLAFDGLRAFRSSFDSNAVDTKNVSEQIKTELQANISSQLGSDTSLQLIHYPKRNWVLAKVGSVIYNYNYTPLYIDGQQVNNGSFCVFNGKLAQQNAYHVDNNGDLFCCGSNGLIYKFDNGNYDDDGDNITTKLQTAWLSLSEPQNSVDIKKGRYIRPTFETGANIAYTISVVGDFTRTSTDSIVTTVAGAGVIGKSVIGISPIGGITPINPKLPLSFRGKEFQITFETNDTKGRDVVNSFNIYAETLGRQ